jgi:hypothetical protein
VFESDRYRWAHRCRLRAPVGAEQRSGEYGEAEVLHRHAHVDRLAAGGVGLPALEHLSRRVGHDRAERADALPVEDGLRQAALATPVLSFAGH